MKMFTNILFAIILFSLAIIIMLSMVAVNYMSTFVAIMVIILIISLMLSLIVYFRIKNMRKERN